MCAGHFWNGVFCVEYGRSVALWNSATREVRVLSFDSSGRFDLDSKSVSCVGFGSVKDERSNAVNFKLLLVVRNYKEEHSIVNFLVYSLRANSLNSIELPCFLLRYISGDGSIYLKGVLHWLTKCGEGAETAYILTFDLVSQTFARIDMTHTHGIDIEDMNHNFLTVLDNQYLSFCMVHQAALCLNMWALHEIDGERSWVKCENFGPLIKDGVMVRYCDRIGGVITQADLDGRFWYQVEGSATADTGLYGLTNWFEYSESLVSLKRIANARLENLEDID